MTDVTNGGGVTAVATKPLALELKGITAGYGRVTVLRDVDLEVQPGKLHAMIGPNGAGKTTLLRVAAGLLRPSAGSVSVNGANVTDRSPHDRVRDGLSLVPEGRGVWPGLSVKENLRLQVPPWVHESDMERVLDVFPAFKSRMRQPAGTLSGGQQQMLAMARCYLAKPSVIALDEPSMGLAPLVIDQIFEFLKRIAAEGVSILLVEQYANRALEIADYAHMLNRGKIVFSGPASEIDEDAVVRGYLGSERGVEANGSHDTPGDETP